MEREVGSAYEGSCLAHYGRRRFGLPMSENGAYGLSVAVILLPVAGLLVSLARETMR